MRRPVGRGAIGGDQHAVRPRQRLRADRIERDQAQVVGVEDRDRVREDHVARRRQLAQRRHVGGQRRRGVLRPRLGGAARDQRLDVRPEALGRGQPVGEERIDRVLVQDADVIRLEEGVDDQLPVGRVLGAHGAERAQAGDAEERQLAVEAAEEARRRRSSRRRRHDPEQAVTLFGRAARPGSRRSRRRRRTLRRAADGAARLRADTSSRGTGRRCSPSAAPARPPRRGACRDGGRR